MSLAEVAVETAENSKTAPIRVNIGCGRKEILEGWVNLDIVRYSDEVVVCDIEDYVALSGIFEESSVDQMRMSHVLEHFDGHRQLRVMENLWKVAKPGAILEVIVPYGQSRHFWRDPDHVRPMFYDSFNAFNQPYYERCDLGYRGDWQIRNVVLVPEADEARYLRLDRKRWLQERAYKLWNCVVEMSARLECVKPIRPQEEKLAGEFTIGVYGA